MSEKQAQPPENKKLNSKDHLKNFPKLCNNLLAKPGTQHFFCFVQVLNYKDIYFLWRGYRTLNYGYCFVSISCRSYIIFTMDYNSAFCHFLWSFCLPPGWPQKECDVAAESTWVLSQQWPPAPHSLQHAPGETAPTPDPIPCLSHRNAQLHDSEPWPNEPRTPLYKKEIQVLSMDLLLQKPCANALLTHQNTSLTSLFN